MILSRRDWLVCRVVVLASITACWSATAGAQIRMLPVPAEEMTEEQKRAVADFKAARNGDLTGPFVPLLRSPELLTVTRVLADYLRPKGRHSLSEKISLFITLITARQWTQQFGWNGHYARAIEAGLDTAVAKAVAEGRRPEHMAEDEAIVYDFSMELQRNGNVSDDTYARAVKKFGERGVLDMVGTTGYFTLIFMLENTVRLPMPAGAQPMLAPFAR